MELTEFACSLPQIAAGERNRQRRDSERQTFHRRRDRARIEDVLAHVLSMIDSAQHEVGPLGHQRFHRQHDAIRRSSIDLVSTVTALDRTDRVVERERMAGRTLLPIGSHDGDLAQWLRRFDQASQPVSEDTVVVGAE